MPRLVYGTCDNIGNDTPTLSATLKTASKGYWGFQQHTLARHRGARMCQ